MVLYVGSLRCNVNKFLNFPDFRFSLFIWIICPEFDTKLSFIDPMGMLKEVNRTTHMICLIWTTLMWFQNSKPTKPTNINDVTRCKSIIMTYQNNSWMIDLILYYQYKMTKETLFYIVINMISRKHKEYWYRLQE